MSNENNTEEEEDNEEPEEPEVHIIDAYRNMIEKRQTEKNIKRVLLQYAKKEIFKIPIDLYQDIIDKFLIDIDLTASQLQSLPDDLLKNAEALNSIDFSNNNLKSVPVCLFYNNLSCLTKVNLSQNNLRSLPEGLFADTPSLKSVSLAGNLLKEIPLDLFENLPNLTHCDISSNELKVFA
jgi:Leucine-rich repeat (LRR) protein